MHSEAARQGKQQASKPTTLGIGPALTAGTAKRRGCQGQKHADIDYVEFLYIHINLCLHIHNIYIWTHIYITRNHYHMVLGGYLLIQYLDPLGGGMTKRTLGPCSVVPFWGLAWLSGHGFSP